MKTHRGNYGEWQWRWFGESLGCVKLTHDEAAAILRRLVEIFKTSPLALFPLPIRQGAFLPGYYSNDYAFWYRTAERAKTATNFIDEPARKRALRHYHLHMQACAEEEPDIRLPRKTNLLCMAHEFAHHLDWCLNRGYGHLTGFRECLVDVCCYLGEPRRPLWLWQSQEDDAQ